MINTIICIICGKEERGIGRWEGKTKAELVTHQMCYACNFWRNKLENPDPDRVIINGQHYIARNDEEGRGFGGQRFIIKKNNGTIIDTRNLWCQGKIDEPWKEHFPDDAIFMDLSEDKSIDIEEDGVPF